MKIEKKIIKVQFELFLTKYFFFSREPKRVLLYYIYE